MADEPVTPTTSVYEQYARPLLAVISALSATGILIIVLLRPIPQENRDVIALVIGTMLGWTGATYTYYFGSSSGSAAKDAIIAKK